MKEYNELINDFSSIDIVKKRKEIINEIQEILMVCHKLSDSKDAILVHNNMKNLDKKDFSEEEFLDGLYAYIISMKEEIAKNICN